MYNHVLDLPIWAQEIIEATYDAHFARVRIQERRQFTRRKQKASYKKRVRIKQANTTATSTSKHIEKRYPNPSPYPLLNDAKKSLKYDICLLVAIFIGMEKCRGNSKSINAFLFYFLSGKPFGDTKMSKNCIHLRSAITDLSTDEITALLPTINHDMISLSNWVTAYRQSVSRMILSFYDGGNRKILSSEDRKYLAHIPTWINEGDSYRDIAQTLGFLKNNISYSEYW